MQVIQQINSKEKIVLIEHASEYYSDAIMLRYEILRKPLGLQFTEEQLLQEKENYHLAYLSNKILLGYVMLVAESEGRMKMKQVAVMEEKQGMGIGRNMVLAAESFANEMGFTHMYCHARDTAVLFYRKLGYEIVGEMFFEVTIPHYMMEKKLT